MDMGDIRDDLREFCEAMDRAWDYSPSFVGYGPVTWGMRDGEVLFEWNHELCEPVFGPWRPLEVVLESMAVTRG